MSSARQTADGPNGDSYQTRLRRIEGQVRGLERMVADDAYCIDVLTQAAASRALQGVAVGLLAEHMRHCLVDAVSAGGEGEADGRITEATAAVERLVKS